MSVRKILLIGTIFLAILTVFRVLWLFFFMTPDHPQAVEGLMDLRNSQHHLDTSITLDGEWEFYPNEFFIDGTVDNQNSNYIQVPGNWSVSHDGKILYGYGTYRLRILVDPEEDKTYGLHVPFISNSSEIYINGELVSGTGKVAKTKHQYEPKNIPYTTYFTLEETNEIDLIIQVANYDDSNSGGIVHSIKFGLAGPINKDVEFSTSIVLVACIIYMVHALYSFILFIVGGRDRRYFYFSLMIVVVVFATLIGERLFFAWSPFNYEWDIKVMFMLMIAGGYFLAQCTKEQLSGLIRAKIFTIYTILCGFSVCIILLLPATYNLSLILFYSIVMLIPCIGLIAVMYQATVRINRDNIFLLLAATAATSSLIWLLIIENFKIDMVSYPFDLMIAMICFSVYWFKQYFRVLRESQNLTSKLQVADRKKDDFLITVAHEMRTPLHGILNISQSVVEREKYTLKEKSIVDMELLVTIGRRMSLLLNDLLDLARFKDNRITIQKQDVSIHSVSEVVIEMLQNITMTKGQPVKLVNQIPHSFPLVYADENRLVQILFNLLYNAVKHSQAGEVSVHASIQAKWARISVIDNGIGMNEEFLEKVFEPYEQASNGMGPSDSGFGLGLNICKQLVELHGGKVEVHSKLNQGTTFMFTLRLSQTTIQSENISNKLSEAVTEQSVTVENLDKKDDVAHPTTNFPPVRILSVDDDPVNLKVLESIFSMEPYDVFSTTRAEEALSMLKQDKWDLVIADVMMPNMSGYELTACIREKYSISELPVLLLTAYNRDEDIETGFRVGANDYVVKPVNAVELQSRVESLIKLRKSVSEQLRMEAAWLQAQIKPHFIINTFNAINALSRFDLDRMDALIQELSNYVRLSIDFQNSDEVAPLERELQLVRSYLYIQQERFGDRLRVDWNVDDHAAIEVPPLSIQPLVENAIEHGILKRANGGEICIRVKVHHQFVEISVVDNGVGIPEHTLKKLLDRKTNERTGIGLLNTNRRLKRFLGNGLEIQTELGVGTNLSFKVPKKR